MTDDEKRQQKAMLLLECVEAEQELAHLEEQAKRISERLTELSTWLNKLAAPNSMETASAEAVYVGYGKHKSIDDPGFTDAMNYERIKTLAKDIATARSKASGLRDRKKSLGLN